MENAIEILMLFYTNVKGSETNNYKFGNVKMTVFLWFMFRYVFLKIAAFMCCKELDDMVQKYIVNQPKLVIFVSTGYHKTAHNTNHWFEAKKYKLVYYLLCLSYSPDLAHFISF